MSELTKQALKVDNNQSFPNNNAGLITPTNLRTFNENMIDSNVNQITYTADSASFDARIDNISGGNTGSLLTTASAVSNVLTFTKGDSSTFNVTVGSDVNITSLNAFTASQLVINSGVNTFTQSADSRLDNIELTTSSLQGEIDNLQSQTGSYATTGSNQFNGNQSISGSVVISGSLRASGLRYPLADNGAKSFVQTDGAGNLSLQYVQSVFETIRNMSGVTLAKGTPVFISGSTGDNGNAYIADASNPSNMPAEYIVGEALSPGQTGLALLSGKIEGVDTTGFPAGTIIYVAEGGGFTSSRPSGSNSIVQVLGIVQKEGNGGQGIIINQLEAELPNLQTGYAWVGNSNNQPIAVQTGSLSSYIFNQNNSFTGTQTFNNIAVNGTASISYLESVTGSAKIIGDAFIILNNDTPTERYAGLIVIDSGSTFASASFLFDGLNNDWFYEYTSALDYDNFGVVLFGPEYNTKGSPIYPTNNRIQKGNGGHHILDSNISDDGSNVSINSNTQITGSLTINGNTPLINSDLTSLNTFTQSQQSVNTNLNAFTASASGRLNNIELTTQSLETAIAGLSSVTGSYATTGSNTFVGNQIITGSLSVSGNSVFTGSVAGNVLSASITSNTASIDFSLANYFEVTSSVTPLHLNVTNITPGRTSTLIISASASSSILFSPNVAQPSGNEYSGSAGSIDILSLVAFSTSKVNLVSTKNMI